MLNIRKNLLGLKTGSLLITVISAGIVGCNESGSSSTESSTTTPIASLKSTTHSLTSATPINAAAIDYAADSETMTKLGLSLSDQTLSFGDVISKFVLKHSPKAREDIVCVNGGSLAWRWVDSDNDAEISTGDSAVILMKDCAILGNTYKGTLTISFVAPSTLNAVAFNTQVKLQEFEKSYQKWLNIQGGFKTEIIADDQKSNFSLSLDKNGLTYAKIFSGKSISNETLKTAVISRNLDFVNARYRLKIDGRVDSESLSDTINIATGKTLEGYLNTYPDAGFFIFKSGKYFTRVSSNYITNNNRVSYLYDKNGDGRLDSSSQYVDWLSFVKGFLFYDTRFLYIENNKSSIQMLTNGNYDCFKVIGVYSPDDSYDVVNRNINSALPTIAYQFSRPINQDTFKPYVLKYAIFWGAQPKPVGLSTNVRGAQVFFKPTNPLLEGQYDLSYSAWTISDITNFYTANPENITFTTTGNLVGKATATSQVAQVGRNVKMNVLANRAQGVKYEWIQTSGTKVDIQGSDTARAFFTVPQLSKPNELLSFKAIITTATGAVQAADLSVYAYQHQDTFELMDFVSEQGDYLGQGKTMAYLDRLYFQWSFDKKAIFATASNTPEGWSLSLSPLDGFKVGLFENAVRYPFNFSRNGLELTGANRGCNQLQGSFVIYEIVFDNNGAISKLAADFIQHCEGNDPALKGRIRYHTVTNM